MERPIKAVKPTEEISDMEAEVAAQLSQVENIAPEATIEETTVTESAPVEEQTVSEDVSNEVEQASETPEEPLTEAEQAQLSDKTRREMSILREKAREADKLREELESIRKQTKAREPLKAVEEEYSKVDEIDDPVLPWERTLTPSEARRIAREEVNKETKLSLISVDANDLESNYPELNPNSDSYDPDLSEDIYTTFQSVFLKNDSVRLKDVAAKKLALISKVKERVLAETAKEKQITRQTAEQALPVNVSAPKSVTTVGDLIKNARTISELDALQKIVK